jgi:uncharacterized protein
MTTMTQHAAGMFCWTQLGTRDHVGANTFYSGLLGWKVESMPIGGEQTFALLKKNDRAVGALYRLADVPPSWLSFVAVDSVDATAAAVKRSGGMVIHEPMDIEEQGRQAIFQDPTGGTFAVWQGRKAAGAGIVNEPGAMCWNELITTDTARAGAFYEQVFGWKREPMKTPTVMGGSYTVFENHGAQAGGMLQATPEMHLTHPYWLVYFGVDDCDRSAAKAGQLGGKAMLPPTDIPGIGRFAVLTDPQGAYFAIIAMAKPM